LVKKICHLATLGVTQSKRTAVTQPAAAGSSSAFKKVIPRKIKKKFG
jgi:hypothetical protein